MSKLSDALVKESAIRKGPLCSVTTAIASLSKADAADMRAALANPAVTSTGLARALRTIDVALSSHAIGRHRRGDCVCPR